MPDRPYNNARDVADLMDLLLRFRPPRSERVMALGASPAQTVPVLHPAAITERPRSFPG